MQHLSIESHGAFVPTLHRLAAAVDDAFDVNLFALGREKGHPPAVAQGENVLGDEAGTAGVGVADVECTRRGVGEIGVELQARVGAKAGSRL